MKIMHVEVTLTEEMLGMASANPGLHEDFIASKAPDAKSREEEVAAIGVEEATHKAMTVFPRNEAGRPILWDYQIKGFFKDTAGALRKVPGTESSKLKAYKKEIDGLIFVSPRMIEIEFEGEVGNCQRPLRAATPQGERVALANSETVPAGAKLRFDVILMADAAEGGKMGYQEKLVREWLDFGIFRGLGQWRNSGKGRFEWRETEG